MYLNFPAVQCKIICTQLKRPTQGQSAFLGTHLFAPYVPKLKGKDMHLSRIRKSDGINLNRSHFHLAWKSVELSKWWVVKRKMEASQSNLNSFPWMSTECVAVHQQMCADFAVSWFRWDWELTSMSLLENLFNFEFALTVPRRNKFDFDSLLSLSCQLRVPKVRSHWYQNLNTFIVVLLNTQ